jgi:very-short-patch-repair endonuclease
MEREAFISSFGIDFLRFRNIEVFERLSDVQRERSLGNSSDTFTVSGAGTN